MTESFDSDDSTQWRDPKIPLTVLDRYQVLGVIGQGGMGTVYKGYHLNLKRLVAIKTLRFDRDRKPDRVQRFLREMALIGQLNHDNVVRASDAGEKNGVLYLVMEHLTGCDLGQVMIRRGPLPTAMACELIRQAALGLEYIHRKLVHRDIKPSNLHLTTEGVVKILDLGLGRFREAELDGTEPTPTGCVLGTYDYMAPEQAIAEKSIDGRADIYSLGCTLFKLLTGQAPFGANQYDTPAKKILAHAQLPLSKAEGFDRIEVHLREVILRMTAKDVEERYSTADEVAKVLAVFSAKIEPEQIVQLGDSDSALHPLSATLPDDLTKLMGAAEPKRPGSSPTRRRLMYGAAVAAMIAAAAVFVIPRFGGGTPNIEPHVAPLAQFPDGPRRLDDLEPEVLHRLLDQRPRCLNGVEENRLKWTWNPKVFELETKWRDLMLFEVGTISKHRYTLEAGIAQTGWTGGVGVFWGYTVDEVAKRERKPEQHFAKYQYLAIAIRIGDQGERLHIAHRGRGAHFFTKEGKIGIHTHPNIINAQPIPFPAGETTLVVRMAERRLQLATFGGTALPGLVGGHMDEEYRDDPYTGGIGLLTMGQHSDFRNVRFSFQE